MTDRFIKRFQLCRLAALLWITPLLAASVSIPVDFTGDQKVTFDDFSVLSEDWISGDDCMEMLGRFAFHWLMDGTGDSDVTVQSVYTDQSRYDPNQLCTVTVICQNDSDVVYSGHLGLYITHHGHAVYSEMQTITIGAGQSASQTFGWAVGEADFKGFLVEAWLDNGSCKVTALDVSSDWKRYPRYGYMTEFYASTTAGETTEMLNTLSRDYHLNCLQYYDWMWRHENVIQRDASGAVVSPWTDWRGAEIALAVLQDSVDKANDRAVSAMPYFQTYIGLDDYEAASGVSPEWGLYTDVLHENQDYHDAGVNMWLFDPGNTDWQDHLCGQFTDALQTLDWAGIHLDQLGDRGSLYDYWGDGPVDLASGMAGVINRTKDHLDALEQSSPDIAGRDAVIFNIVNGDVDNWVLQEALASRLDIVYSELWDNETYGGVRDFIRYIKHTADAKPVVLAAYMNRYEETGDGCFDLDSVLLADAAFFACGAYHIELGDGDSMLSQEFFPSRDKLMSQELKARLKDYYNFITAYEQLLFSPDLRLGDGGLQWISADGYTLSGDGTADTVWFLNRGSEAFEIFHLINLKGHDNQWRNIADSPTILEDVSVTLRLGPDAAISGVFWASPDSEAGIMQPLKYETGSDSQGDFLSIVLPKLEYWDMIYIERRVDAPSGGRYEAEDAVLWNVGTNTNHSGYSGSGFVDLYADVDDSINFYVTVAEAGDVTFRFRYGNGGSSASRSVIVNGTVLGDVTFANSGSWDDWTTAEKTVSLEPGVHQVTLYYGSWNSGAINLDCLEVE